MKHCNTGQKFLVLKQETQSKEVRSFAAKQKYAAMAAHREAKKSDPKRIFNRYTDEAILSGDRAVGNYVEWMVSEYATV